MGPVTGGWARQEDTPGVTHILCPCLCPELQLCQALPSVSQRSLGGFSLSGDGHRPSPVCTVVTFLPGPCAGEPRPGAQKLESGVVNDWDPGVGSWCGLTRAGQLPQSSGRSVTCLGICSLVYKEGSSYVDDGCRLWGVLVPP
jgi:hypothetical protein